MKQINGIIILLTLALFSATQLYPINVRPASGPYIVGQTIYFSGTSVNWDAPWVLPRITFGDGSHDDNITHSNEVGHRYRQAGTYNVELLDQGYYVTPYPSEYYTITITDIRRITYSPTSPVAGQTITFIAENFATPQNIRWDFGDGVIITQHESKPTPQATQQVTHRYTLPGSYTVKAYDWDGAAAIPITLNITIAQPARSITASTTSPREDQPVEFQANNFISQTIDWNFGDGEGASGSAMQSHRFMTAGQIVVSALDRGYTQTPTTLNMTILPENRSIVASPPLVMINQPVTLTAQMFRGDGVLWNFGDGTQIIGSHQESHSYPRAGKYTVTARDESGASQRSFSAEVTVQGITDEVILHKAELRFDNGRAYRIVPRNSQHMQAELQLKMGGTGLITGIWILDGNPFRPFSQLAKQGDVTVIRTGLTPALPTIEPGLHRLTVQLTRPQSQSLPEISYYVEAESALLELQSPIDGFNVKEDEVPKFSWTPVRGTAWYELGFADSLYPFLFAPDSISWQTVREGSECFPDSERWAALPRNRPVFWQIRAKDSARQLISQSEPRALQLSLNPATITISSITSLDGTNVTLPGTQLPMQLIIRGTISFPGEAQYLILRVFADERMVNQLLFRDPSPDKSLSFTSSAPTKGTKRITLQVLKPVTPAVVIGVRHLQLTQKGD